uniref:Uncharacterized protein LOC117352134 isoform X2 n=3 Tax=Geotrypetes seraphini TaxID=260995 RepID=A0A6P8QAF4_GEOSA|nr:uncharacterized protein LOC117352134 isoform X2 [Geotrypetes seraphini]
MASAKVCFSQRRACQFLLFWELYCMAAVCVFVYSLAHTFSIVAQNKGKHIQDFQSLLIRLLPQTSYHSLDRFKSSYVLCQIQSPKLNTILQVWPHQQPIQGHQHLLLQMDHQVDLSPVLLGLCDGGVMTGGTFSYLPFLSPDGYIYEKEAILEYILHQKKEITLQLKAYEKQRSELKTEQEELSKAAKESQVKGFLEKEMSIVLKPLNPLTALPG